MRFHVKLEMVRYIGNVMYVTCRKKAQKAGHKLRQTFSEIVDDYVVSLVRSLKWSFHEHMIRVYVVYRNTSNKPMRVLIFLTIIKWGKF